jgi:hypothetical protein
MADAAAKRLRGKKGHAEVRRVHLFKFTLFSCAPASVRQAPYHSLQTDLQPAQSPAVTDPDSPVLGHGPANAQRPPTPPPLQPQQQPPPPPVMHTAEAQRYYSDRVQGLTTFVSVLGFFFWFARLFVCLFKF